MKGQKWDRRKRDFDVTILDPRNGTVAGSGGRKVSPIGVCSHA